MQKHRQILAERTKKINNKIKCKRCRDEFNFGDINIKRIRGGFYSYFCIKCAVSSFDDIDARNIYNQINNIENL
jgi:late competence protein required for DNA uptake (superfamily II DNA/RNA helicase)